jgi:ubiquinone biosynthesis protein UbiJ
MDQVRALQKALSENNQQLAARPPAQQRIGAQLLATEAARTGETQAIEALSKLGESLEVQWKDICSSSVGYSERNSSSLQEAESALRTALLKLENAANTIRESSERFTAEVAAFMEKTNRVLKRCDDIERDISPEAKDS